MDVASLSSNISDLNLTQDSDVNQKCLRFYSEALPGSDKAVIIALLEAAWAENAPLALKLVFHLRDVRKGKRAFTEFHHCLLWLFEKHPQTLLENLQHMSLHGYWKDVSWIIRFILKKDVAMTIEPQKPKSNAAIKEHFVYIPSKDLQTNVEELIRKQQNGQLDKLAWHKFLKSLPNEEARKSARKAFDSAMKAFHLEESQRAKAAKKAIKAAAAEKLEKLMKEDPKFSAIYNKVVELFAKTLVEDKQTLNATGHLPSTALCGKWAPTIGCSIDTLTLLGKNIALALYPEESHHQEIESLKAFRQRIFIKYQREYLTPLRQSIGVTEALMSKHKWQDVQYDRVPSLCLKRNKSTFIKRDQQRFSAFEDTKVGKKRENPPMLPHGIVGHLMTLDRGRVDHSSWSENAWDSDCNSGLAADEELVCKKLEEKSQAQWDDWLEHLKKVSAFQSSICVCDVADSMVRIPMEVAIALSLLLAELAPPPYKNVVFSFSKTPKLHQTDQPSLRAKVEAMASLSSRESFECNLSAIFDQILGLALQSNLLPDQMIRNVFVFTCMDFELCGGKEYESNYQMLRNKFRDAGYSMPQLIFWNLRGDGSKPIVQNQPTARLVTAFSNRQLDFFLKNGTFESPLDAMLSALGNHYDHLKVVD